MSQTTELLNGLTALQQRLSGQGPDWVQELRERSRQRFDALGFPTTRVEEWRNTSVAPIIKTGFKPVDGAALPDDLPEIATLDLGGPRLIFANGVFSAEHSTGCETEDLWVGSLSQALQCLPDRVRPHLASDEDPAAFEALNGAFVEEGAVVLVSDRAQIDTPVQLVFVSGGAAEPSVSQPRVLLVAGDGSRVQVVESWAVG